MWRARRCRRKGCGFYLDLLQLVENCLFSSFRSSRVEKAEATFVQLPHEDRVHTVQLTSESILPQKGASITRMPANGAKLILDRDTRVRKIEQISEVLGQVEGKHPQVSACCRWVMRERTGMTGGCLAWMCTFWTAVCFQVSTREGAGVSMGFVQACAVLPAAHDQRQARRVFRMGGVREERTSLVHLTMVALWLSRG